jgi:hypothetical protein
MSEPNIQYYKLKYYVIIVALNLFLLFSEDVTVFVIVVSKEGSSSKVKDNFKVCKVCVKG